MWLLVWSAVLTLLAQPGAAQTSTEKLERARIFFEQAQQSRQSLESSPREERTRQDYLKVIQAFRSVYYTTHLYGNNTVCLMAIAELFREAGQRWEQKNDFEAAIDALEFLIREYPHSRYVSEAQVMIARILHTDLGRPKEALQRYQAYLAKYPRSALAAEARKAVEEIGKELERGSLPPEVTAAVAAARETAEKSPGSSKQLPQITNIRHWATPDYTRVVIDVDGEVKYGVERLSNPPRIYVDLYQARLGSNVLGKTIPVEYDLLQSIRTGRPGPDVARVVLDVGNVGQYSIFELPNPYRLVIDVRSAPAAGVEASQPAAAETVKTPPVPAPSAQTAASAKTPTPSEPAQTAKATESPIIEKVQPAQPNRNGSHSLTRALGLKIGRIVIDPGHGGHDTGTIGPTGLHEKELVLDLARRLRQIIAEQLGSEVVLTREEDTFVPLEARTALANERQADLFLSIHANASRSKSARGIETYYLNFTTDAEALEVAARENAVSQETISQLQTLVQKIAMADKVDESREFAARVHKALGQGLSGSNRRGFDRGVKKAPFVVLIGANMPSVLTEVSFLSNPQDEKLLRTAEHRQKIAEALFAGIQHYVETLSGVKVAHTENAAARAQQ
ncbi:MAG: N-acetylmuramoyl-L-alanine amidase [Acidobacteria bacterium]|nr:N-acetylmuramoyl-L-alanine amidase [Acidobacteriota bacterium]